MARLIFMEEVERRGGVQQALDDAFAKVSARRDSSGAFVVNTALMSINPAPSHAVDSVCSKHTVDGAWRQGKAAHRARRNNMSLAR
jgi:hypothetical protein